MRDNHHRMFIILGELEYSDHTGTGCVTIERFYGGDDRSTPTPDRGREKNGPHGSADLQCPSCLKDLNTPETPAAIGSGRFNQFGCLRNLETAFHRDPI
jgi:hypothetical protein